MRPAGEMLSAAHRLLPHGGWNVKYQMNAELVHAAGPLAVPYEQGSPRVFHEIAPFAAVSAELPNAVPVSSAEGAFDPVRVPT